MPKFPVVRFFKVRFLFCEFRGITDRLQAARAAFDIQSLAHFQIVFAPRVQAAPTILAVHMAMAVSAPGVFEALLT
jgi:hypothetical protein